MLRCCRCEPRHTLFPRYCTPNNTQIPGDLMVDTWQLVDIPTYGCCIVLAGVAMICHIGSFLLMKYVHCPHTV